MEDAHVLFKGMGCGTLIKPIETKCLDLDQKYLRPPFLLCSVFRFVPLCSLGRQSLGLLLLRLARPKCGSFTLLPQMQTHEGAERTGMCNDRPEQGFASWPLGRRPSCVLPGRGHVRQCAPMCAAFGDSTAPNLRSLRRQPWRYVIVSEGKLCS